MATRKSKTPVKPSQSDDAEDLLSGLQDSAAQKTTASKKPTRETMSLSVESQSALELWAMANAVFKIAESQLKASKAGVEDSVWEELTDNWVANEARPNNPQLTTPKAKGIYQIREKYSVDIPDNKSVTDLLVDVGFSHEIASKIEKTEVSIKPETTLLPFEDMYYSDDPQMKDLATKLMKLVKDNFTPEERSLILETKKKVKVSEHFLDRAHSYCQTGEELRSLFTVIKPEHFPSQGQCTEGLDMNAVYQQVLSPGLPKKEEEYVVGDGSYKIKRKDKTVDVFMRGKTKVIASRICNDAGHAHNFALKLVRDTACLVSSLEKYAV